MGRCDAKDRVASLESQNLISESDLAFCFAAAAKSGAMSPGNAAWAFGSAVVIVILGFEL